MSICYVSHFLFQLLFSELGQCCPLLYQAVGKISPSVFIKQLSPEVLSTLEKPRRTEKLSPQSRL